MWLVGVCVGVFMCWWAASGRTPFDSQKRKLLRAANWSLTTGLSAPGTQMFRYVSPCPCLSTWTGIPSSYTTFTWPKLSRQTIIYNSNKLSPSFINKLENTVLYIVTIFTPVIIDEQLLENLEFFRLF